LMLPYKKELYRYIFHREIIMRRRDVDSDTVHIDLDTWLNQDSGLGLGESDSDADDTSKTLDQYEESLVGSDDSPYHRSTQSQSLWWDDAGVLDDNLIDHASKLFSKKKPRSKSTFHCESVIFPTSLAKADTPSLKELHMLKANIHQLSSLEDQLWIASQFTLHKEYEQAQMIMKDVKITDDVAFSTCAQINNIRGQLCVQQRRFSEAGDLFKQVLKDFDDVEEHEFISSQDKHHLLSKMQAGINGAICKMEEQKYVQVSNYLKWMDDLDQQTPIVDQSPEFLTAYGTACFVWGRALLKLGYPGSENLLNRSIEKLEEAHRMQKLLIEKASEDQKRRDALQLTSAWIQANIGKAYCGLKRYDGPHGALKYYDDSRKDLEHLRNCKTVIATKMALSLEQAKICLKQADVPKATTILTKELAALDDFRNTCSPTCPNFDQLSINARLVLTGIEEKKVDRTLRLLEGLI